MTRRSVFLCAFALASMLTFAGCQTAPTRESKRDVAADLKAINALSDQYAAAFNSGDVAASVATYADDAILMGPNTPAFEGKQAIQSAHESQFKFYADRNIAATLSSTPLETEAAGDWAYQRGNYTNTFTPKSGKPMEDSGKYLSILKRQLDGAWKTYRLMLSRNAPPPTAAGEKR